MTEIGGLWKRDLAGVGGENENEGWGSGDGSESGSVMENKKEDPYRSGLFDLNHLI